MRLDPLLIRLPESGGVPSFWGIPDEVVACCAISYLRTTGFSYQVTHRFWNHHAADLCQRLCNTTGRRPPLGLKTESRRKVSLSEALKLNDSVGGLPPSFLFGCLRDMGLNPTSARAECGRTDSCLRLIGWAEGFLQFLSAQRSQADVFLLPLVRSLQRRLQLARFITASWDAFRIACTVAGVYPTHLEILKERLLYRPYQTAADLKQFAGYCRATAFGEKVDPPDLLFLLKKTTVGQMIQLSFIARCLPAPIHYVDPLPDYFNRMARPSVPWPPGRRAAFQAWLVTWMRRNKPKDLRISTTFTTSGCLERVRSKGGIPAALAAYSLWEFCKQSAGSPGVDLGQLVSLVPPPKLFPIAKRWELLL
jgi:hypothetical protein